MLRKVLLIIFYFVFLTVSGFGHILKIADGNILTNGSVNIINDTTKGDFVSYEQQGSHLDIISTKGKLKITAYTSSTIKVSYLPDGI